MFKPNLTTEVSYYNTVTNSSHEIDFNLKQARKWNIFALLPIILIGLIGHCLIIFVFIQKRFRTNSNNVFILCLAFTESLYLLNHFFEDTLRTFNDIYIENNSTIFNRFMLFINITDKYDLSCRIINYLKFVLSFLSSYILVSITIQRLLMVFKPMFINKLSKNKACLTVAFIILISLIFNFWVPCIFELKRDLDASYCDINEDYSTLFFKLKCLFAFVTILLPILVIFTSNLLIIENLRKAELKRKELTNLKMGTKSLMVPLFVNKTARTDLLDTNKPSKDLILKPFYLSLKNYANKTTNSIDDSKNASKILFVSSNLFVLLNFPYLIVWFMIIYKNHQLNFDYKSNDVNLFSALQICEIIYHCNFTTLFFIYCATGSKFRNQLKHSSKKP